MKRLQLKKLRTQAAETVKTVSLPFLATSLGFSPSHLREFLDRMPVAISDDQLP